MKVPPLSKMRIKLSILWPHELFAYMYHHYKCEFMKRLCGGAVSNISNFWASQKKHPAYGPHPMHTHGRFDFRRFGIPLGLHGDGITVIGVGKKLQKHMDCLSWSSLLARASFAKHTSFVILFIFELMLLKSNGVDTNDAIWGAVVWSLYWMYQGIWPDRDWTGRMYTAEDGWRYNIRLTPLAEGYFGVTWAVRADLDYVRKKFGLGGAGTSCHLCASNTSDIPWTSVSLMAFWIAVIWENASFAEQHPGRHRLMRHVPGVGISVFIPDILHVKHLGTDAYYLGGLLALLVKYVMPGTQEDNLATLWIAIEVVYKRKRTRNRFGAITLGMIKSSKKPLPCLSGRGLQVKDLVPVMIDVSKGFLDMGKAEHRDILCGLEASSEMDKILDSHIEYPCLPEAVATKFCKMAFDFGACVTSLVRFYHPEVPVFHHTDKLHLLLHLGLISKYINPGLGSCYQGEEMMGVVRRIVNSSARASKPATALKTSMARYCRGLSFDFCRSQEWWH